MTSGAENAFTLAGRLVTLRSARVQDLNRLAEARDDGYITEAFNAPPDPADAKAAAAWLEGTGALARAGIGYSFVIAIETAMTRLVGFRCTCGPGHPTDVPVTSRRPTAGPASAIG